MVHRPKVLVALVDRVQNGLVVIEVVILFQVTHAAALIDGYFTRRLFENTCQDLHEG